MAPVSQELEPPKIPGRFKATSREWLVNVGRRWAPERLAHLFCELHLRLQAVGLAEQDSYALPITQMDLADTTGLSSVHVNRTL